MYRFRRVHERLCAPDDDVIPRASGGWLPTGLSALSHALGRPPGGGDDHARSWWPWVL